MYYVNNKDIDVFSNTAFDEDKKDSGLDFNDLVTIDEDLFPDQYFCICSEDHKVYIFDFNFAANSVTGKFRPLDNYLTFDTAEAKEKFEDAIKASAEISSIKDTLGDAAGRTGVFAEIDAAETKITNVTTSVINLESKVVNELEPKVEQAKEDIKDIQT